MIHIHRAAELTGVTVRTLRYYDKIGLLAPASKTEGGHRLYTNDDIKCMQQIQFLKRIGFSLEEIKKMLNSEDWDWTESIKDQLAYVLKEQEQLKQMESSLRELVHGIAIEGEEGWMAAIAKIMHLSSKDTRLKQDSLNSVFQPREKKLLEKVPSMASEDPDSLEWIALIGQLKRHMGAGPQAPRIQHIIRRMDEKRLENFEGEDEFIDQLWEIRMSPALSEKMNLYPMDQDVLKFMEEAYRIYILRGENG
ncbi:MerR family transcriptional regulator [Fictibacillus fluitans]|uniref:MerR family transcriptional regulator n=1 Tax=Fictibacillus fluitans TaxID=3058422 RepID=A0ABT8I091_9BACL|nr:MerR family transcriptional regulator [Fictibacillus sp. NE201]MDN4526454.1 MerR family transcriptional regulator [Fictibacillus sp. NE201]